VIRNYAKLSAKEP